MSTVWNRGTCRCITTGKSTTLSTCDCGIWTCMVTWLMCMMCMITGTSTTTPTDFAGGTFTNFHEVRICGTCRCNTTGMSTTPLSMYCICGNSASLVTWLTVGTSTVFPVV